MCAVNSRAEVVDTELFSHLRLSLEHERNYPPKHLTQIDDNQLGSRKGTWKINCNNIPIAIAHMTQFGSLIKKWVHLYPMRKAGIFMRLD